jgi:hypothetical protein
MIPSNVGKKAGIKIFAAPTTGSVEIVKRIARRSEVPVAGPVSRLLIRVLRLDSRRARRFRFSPCVLSRLLIRE